MRLLFISLTLILSSCNSNPSQPTNTPTRQVDHGVAAQIREHTQRELAKEEAAKEKRDLNHPELRSE
jgi:hypothetical protein